MTVESAQPETARTQIQAQPSKVKQLLAIIREFIGYVILAILLLAVIRPDIIHLPFTKEAQVQDLAPLVSQGAELTEETVDDGWFNAHPHTATAEDMPRELRLVKLSSPRVADLIGLRVAPIESRSLVDRVEGNAELAYDEHVYAEVVPRVASLVQSVRADHGMKCQKGDLLAVVDSAEVGIAKADYLSARATAELAEATFERTATLTSRDALPRRSEVEAKAALNKARADLLGSRQRLRNLGYSDEELEQIARESDTSSLLELRSPITGTVIDLHAVVGEALEATTVMFRVTDLRRLWVWIDVNESEFAQVRKGQPLYFTSAPGEPNLSHGTVEWIDTAVNPVTRTVRVLGVLDNQDEQLRANQFGWGSITVGKPRQAVVIPREAIQDFAPGVGLVFLQQDPVTFRPQRVVTNTLSDRDFLEVTWGLEPSGHVVTTGSFILMSELRRGELVGD